MTDITPMLRSGTAIIQSYKNGVLQISDTRFAHPVMVMPSGVRDWDGVSFDDLPPHDVLIFGTGETQIWPDAQIRVRVPMEVMTTPAACRTYNALVSDGREVLALLIPFTPAAT